MFYTTEEWNSYFNKWASTDHSYLRTIFADDISLHISGIPTQSGIENVLTFNKTLTTFAHENVDVTSFVTDGKTAVAGLIVLNFNFRSDLPEFGGFRDIKAGDKAVGKGAAFVFPL